nr:putative ribonuclease H-like domain-containing protein [Tanacetum cinerariifolium]
MVHNEFVIERIAMEIYLHYFQSYKLPLGFCRVLLSWQIRASENGAAIIEYRCEPFEILLSKNGTTTSSDYEEITTCKNGATSLGPAVIFASIATTIGSYIRWKLTVVHPRVNKDIAYVPAGSRNSSASTSAGRSIPAASRNTPASIHAGRHISASRFNMPAPFLAGRSVPTGNKEKLGDFVQIKGGTITFGGRDGKITGKVLTKEFQKPDESQVVLRIPSRHDLYTFNLSDIQPEQHINCLLAKASLEESTKWHRRMAHVNFKTINKLAKNGLVEGLPLKLFTNEHNGVACNKGKQHKASYKAISAVRTISKPLKFLHMDLFGPTSIRSIDHKYYSLVVTDDFSRFSWAFFLKTKDETFYILKDFIALIENQLNKKVKAIRCDNGTEFWNAKLIDLCGENGIKRDYKAVSTACYVLNRVSITNPYNKTPYELMSGKVPNIRHLKPFGCQVTILNTSDHLGKFEGKANDGFLVGYAANSKAYRVYNLSRKKVEETLNLRYLEDKPNVHGLGQKWYFNLDYLTDSLGYTRFKTNTSAGTQDTNINAGTQDDDSESKCDEQAILVPSFPSNSFSGPKVNDVSAPMENNLDYAKEIARLQRQEHEAYSTDAKYGFEFSNETTEMLHQAEINTRRNLVLAAGDPAGSIVSTDGVPAGRVPAGSVPASHIPASSVPVCSVPASNVPVGGILAGSINSVGFGDPVASESVPTVFTPDPAASESVPAVFTPDYVANSTLPLGHSLGSSKHSTRFPSPSDLRNHQPMAGIFSSFSYDDDFYADVTKLASRVAVDPIATKRILKNKRDARGIVVRNKARLVAQGHRKEEGIDYDEVFAPVARIKAIRLFLAFASYMGFMVYQMDVKSAFLYEEIEEEVYVYVTQPKGFEDPHNPKHVYRVVKALYGLHQAPRARPDIMFAASACSRHQVIPITSHLNAVKKIFKYLKGKPNLGRRLISWQCKKQTVVATSFTKAGYVAAASTGIKGRNKPKGRLTIVYFVYTNSRAVPVFLLVVLVHADEWVPTGGCTIPTGSYSFMLMDGFLLVVALFLLDDHNKVAYLEKGKGWEAYEQILDFLNRSHIWYALTHCPPIVFDSLVKQFWATAIVRTLEAGPSEIIATIAGNEMVVLSLSYGTTDLSPRPTFDFTAKLFSNMKLNWDGPHMPLLAPMLVVSAGGDGDDAAAAGTTAANEVSPPPPPPDVPPTYISSSTPGPSPSTQDTLVREPIPVREPTPSPMREPTTFREPTPDSPRPPSPPLYPRSEEVGPTTSTRPPSLTRQTSFQKDISEGGGDYVSLPKSNEAPPTTVATAAGGAEDSAALTDLSLKLDRLINRVTTLENEFGVTKKVLGGAVLKLVSKEQDIDLDALHQLASTSFGGDTTVEAAYTIYKASQDAHASSDAGHDEDEVPDDTTCLSDVHEPSEDTIPAGDGISANAQTIPAGSTPIPSSGGVSASSSMDPAGQAAAAAPSSIILAADKGKAHMVDDSLPADLLTEQERILKNLHDYQLGEDLAKKLHAKQEAEFARQQKELAQKAQAESVASPAEQGTGLSAQRRQELNDAQLIYTEADWLELMAKIVTNSTLSKQLLGDDVNEDNMNERLGWTMKQVPASVPAASFTTTAVSVFAAPSTATAVSVPAAPSIAADVQFLLLHLFMLIQSASDSDDDPLPYAPYASWEMVPTPLGSIHAYYDMEGYTKHFTSLRELLHMVEKNDLRKLLGAVDNLYQREEPDTFALILWGDLCVHVLETVDGRVIYMFVDVSYPLSAATLKCMLKHGLEVPKLFVGGDLTMAEQLLTMVHSQERVDSLCGYGSGVYIKSVDGCQVTQNWMVITFHVPFWNDKWLVQRGMALELISPEQTATGKDVSNPFMAVMVCQKPLGYFSSPMIYVPRAGLVINPPGYVVPAGRLRSHSCCWVSAGKHSSCCQ